jgi:hypothetical protein
MHPRLVDTAPPALPRSIASGSMGAGAPSTETSEKTDPLSLRKTAAERVLGAMVGEQPRRAAGARCGRAPSVSAPV